MRSATCSSSPVDVMDSVDLLDCTQEPSLAFPIQSELSQTRCQSIFETLNSHTLGADMVELVMEVAPEYVGRQANVVEGENTNMKAPLEPAVGLEFESPDAARTFYCAHANRVGFCVRNSKSFTSRVDETVIMRRFVCSKQGRPTKKDLFDLTKRRRNRKSSREGCKALFQVNRRDSGRWVVSRCVVEHCHSLGIVPKTSAATMKKLRRKPWQLTVCPSTDEVQQNGLGAGGGVVQSLLEHFKRMQSDNPAFFYALQVDKCNCVSSVFWADARARMAYSCFGDVVIFDQTCKSNKRMIPFAAFTGLNHHRQLIVFGSAFTTDQSESSFTWLFQTWLTLMRGRHPVSLDTGLNDAIEVAAEKVFQNVCHRFSKRDVFNKCKEKLSNVYSTHPTFKEEFKKTVNDSETKEQFELCWGGLIAKFGVENNFWLRHLYDIRQKWVPVYLRSAFFAEVSADQKLETMEKFFQRHSITTTNLRDIAMQFDKAMGSQYEKELQADSATICSGPVLKTPFPIEKQASDIYTRIIFHVFQVELIESSDFLLEKIEDNPLCKYRVKKVEDSGLENIVIYNHLDNLINCSCHKFEFSGILCRHILRVCLVVGFVILPETYILRRWTRNAKSNMLFYDYNAAIPINHQKTLSCRCNDLVQNAITYAEEGASSSAIYKVAKTAIQKAFIEVLASKTFARSAMPGR